MLCRLLLVLVFTATGLAQPLLLRGDAAALPAEIRFDTPGGPAAVAPRLVQLSPGLTVLADARQLASPAFSAGLARLFQPRKEIRIGLLAIDAAGQPQRASATSRAQLTAALRTMAAQIPVDTPPPSFEALLRTLRTLEGLEWKQVIYAGEEPLPAAETRDYAYALLLRTLGESRISLSHAIATDASAPAWVNYLRAVGGRISAEGPASLVEAADGGWFEAVPPAAGPAEGFRLLPLQLRPSGVEPLSLPWIWTTSRKPLPDLSTYADFVTRRARAAAATVPSQADIEALLAVNPSDLTSLKLAVNFAVGNRDTAVSIRYLVRVLELEPSNGPYWARLALDYWQSGDADNTERCLLRAREEKADPPQSAVILAEIHWKKKDYTTAGAHYREALRREPERVELWLKLADTELALGRKPETAAALEEALKRKPDLWPQRTQLLEYYLEVADSAAAQRQLAVGIPLLPADAALVARFATYAERLNRAPDALGLWTRVIELDSSNEPAHYSVTRLHRESGNLEKTLAAAERGVQAAPQSARLAVLHVDALGALGRIEEQRRVLQAVTPKLPDLELLRRAADLEDRYGSESPRHYRSLVEGMRKAGAVESAWRPVAERGLNASIREEETGDCEWFAGLLQAKLCAPAAPPPDAPTVEITGGIRALLLMARGPSQSSAASGMADYSRTVMLNASNKQRKNLATEAYRERLVEYFRLLADLDAMGKRAGGKATVRLSLENKDSARVTERVLALLGWRTRRDSGKLVVEPAVKGKKAKRQDLASALAIDVVAMQENLQSGKDFVLEIEHEPVVIFPAERVWQDQFYAGERYPGGFVEALVRKTEMAALYAALSNMERGSAALLVQSVGIKPLAEKYSTLLAMYSPCLQIAGGRVEVPGGAAAASVWAALVKAQPTDARRFLRELLDKDDGRLLRFYFLLSQLDLRRQRFFTASTRRITAFYEVFRDSAQVEHKTARVMGSASIADLFRELPIDAEGHLEFPGSPEVWMVAKSKTSSVQSTEKRVKKLARVTTPEVEDEILIRMLKSDYVQNHSRFGAWENLLAVVRVDAVRAEPLDEPSALMLAEKFAFADGLYGYFTRLTALEAAHFREIFGFVEKVQGTEWRTANLNTGLFHGMFALLAAAEESHRLPPAKAAALAGDFAKALNQAQSMGQRTQVTLDALQAYLRAMGAKDNPPSLREYLLPVAADSTFVFEERSFAVGQDLRRDFDRVLEMQSVPRMDELLALHDALRTLASGKDDTRAAAAVIVNGAQKIRDPETGKETGKRKLPSWLAGYLQTGNHARFTELNSDLQKEIARKKLSGNLPKLAGEYWEALALPAVVTLAGQIYAAHLRAGDMLVSEDPMLIREHRFVYPMTHSQEYFGQGALQNPADDIGSAAAGGFDGIAGISGAAAAAGLRTMDPNAGFVAGALLGSVRTTNWSAVDAKTLRATAIRIHAAKDWLILAAAHRPVLDAVAAATYGAISLNRRARLLLALEQRDWESAWATLSLPDLFFLAGRLREALPASAPKSPAIAEYLAGPAVPEGAGALGPALPILRRYATPVLMDLPPYEDTATEPYPQYLAERLSEFKLYLAYLFAREGLPPEGLPAAAELATREVLSDIQMSDYRDWQAVIAAYENFDRDRLREALSTK